MRVLATRFKPGVTITVVGDDAGVWRFSHWSKHASASNMRPSAEDSARAFPDAETAVRFFRTRYARVI